MSNINKYIMDIGNDLYEIKHKINDEEYLRMNNNLKKLYDILKEKYPDGINHICSCEILNINIYGSTIPVENYFCNVNHITRECYNFNMLCVELPLLKNLIPNHYDNNFTNDIINSNINKNYYNKIINILTTFNAIFRNKNDKIIITLVIYDFIFRNIGIVKSSEYTILIDFIKKKYIEFSNDNEFIDIQNRYQIDKEKWLNIIISL
jgi:hypothetical protein